MNTSNTSAGSQSCLMIQIQKNTSTLQQDLKVFKKSVSKFREASQMQGNLNLIWFFDQELMILELKYKQHVEDFNRINTFQQEGGFIERNEAPKSIVCSSFFV